MGNPWGLSLGVVALSISLTACGLVNNAPQLVSGIKSKDQSLCVASLGYADVQPILARSCVGCHGGNSRTNLTNYTDVFNLRDRIKVQVETGAMPMGSTLDSTSKNTIVSWVAAGAPEVGDTAGCEDSTATPPTPPVAAEPPQPEPEPEPQPLVATYEGIKSSFLAAKCIGCHQAGGPAQLYDFSSYSSMMGVFEFIDDKLFDVEDPEKSEIVKSVRGDGNRLMPPTRSKIPPLDEAQIQQLIAWISKAMPEK